MPSIEHPSWCNTRACPVTLDTPNAQHRSVVVQAPGRLRAVAHLTQRGTAAGAAFVRLSVDSAMYGTSEIDVSAVEALDLGEFLISLARLTTSYRVGDRVRDSVWDQTYTGTVRRIDSDGDLYVTWDGHFAEHQMRPDQVTREDGAKL